MRFFGDDGNVSQGFSTRPLFAKEVSRDPSDLVLQIIFSPGEFSWTRQLQRFFLPYVIQVPCSHSIGENWGGKFHTIGNPYQEQNFLPTRHLTREASTYCFVGRLVNDKGVDLFSESPWLCRKDKGWKGTSHHRGRRRMSVESYEQEAKKLGLEFNRVHRVLGLEEILQEAADFAQPVSSVLVVPSRWKEPFGMVAVEGLACGCRLVVSEGGGLPEAAGLYRRRLPKWELASTFGGDGQGASIGPSQRE